jgi:hypothetical protein
MSRQVILFEPDDELVQVDTVRLEGGLAAILPFECPQERFEAFF